MEQVRPLSLGADLGQSESSLCVCVVCACMCVCEREKGCVCVCVNYFGFLFFILKQRPCKLPLQCDTFLLSVSFQTS